MRDDVRPGAVVGGAKMMVGGIVEEEHGARDASSQHEEMRQHRTFSTYDLQPFPTGDIPGLGRLVGSADARVQLGHLADRDGRKCREPAAKERTHVQWGMPEMTRFVPAVDGEIRGPAFQEPLCGLCHEIGKAESDQCLQVVLTVDVDEWMSRKDHQWQAEIAEVHRHDICYGADVRRDLEPPLMPAFCGAGGQGLVEGEHGACPPLDLFRMSVQRFRQQSPLKIFIQEGNRPPGLREIDTGEEVLADAINREATDAVQSDTTRRPARTAAQSDPTEVFAQLADELELIELEQLAQRIPGRDVVETLIGAHKPHLGVQAQMERHPPQPIFFRDHIHIQPCHQFVRTSWQRSHEPQPVVDVPRFMP